MKNAKKVFHVVEVTDSERPVFSRKGLFLFTITSKLGSVGSRSSSTHKELAASRE